MASFNLLFGNLLMFTPPVGRCSALVYDNVFYVFINKKTENVFGFLCMGEKLLELFFVSIR